MCSSSQVLRKVEVVLEMRRAAPSQARTRLPEAPPQAVFFNGEDEIFSAGRNEVTPVTNAVRPLVKRGASGRRDEPRDHSSAAIVRAAWVVARLAIVGARLGRIVRHQAGQ